MTQLHNHRTNARSVVALLCLMPVSSVGDCDPIRALQRESRGYRCEAPTREELKIAERLFEHLLRGESNLWRVVPLCQQLGLDLIHVTRPGDEVLVLMEIESEKTGRGFYVFRRTGFRPVVFQAPHAFEDLHTGVIVRKLFSETRALAAAFNTVTRSENLKACGEKCDLAHLEDTYFQAFTAAFARLYPDGLALQVHGFSKKKRTSGEGALADVVISNGTREPGRWLKTLADCLDEKLNRSIAVYPRDIPELGATTNVQGKLLRRLGHSGFVHIEFSLRSRQRLLASEEDRRRFWLCVPERLR